MTEFIWVTALRLLSSLAVLIAPLPAFWACGHLDRWDWSMLGMPDASAHQQNIYQYWDKCVDTFTLAIGCIVALSWKDGLVRRLAIATFGWRLVGFVIFMATGNEAVLVVFPDVFGKLFLFYLVFRVLSRRDLMLRSGVDAVIVLVAVTVPKVAEEYFIHVGSRPWQTVTLLPASISTSDREYWLWVPIMLALPILAMTRLLLENRATRGAEEKIPLVTAILGRQITRAPAGTQPRAATPPLPLGSAATSEFR